MIRNAMLKKTGWFFNGLLIVLFLTSSAVREDMTRYKCMLQMKNYTGEKAYVIISLMNPEGTYEKTLYVNGDDTEWYSDIPAWWDFQGKKRADLDAITGATIGNGERKIQLIEIPSDKIDAGYKIRFETAVEDQEYYEKDIEVALTSAITKEKHTGKGYIRYVRLLTE